MTVDLHERLRGDVIEATDARYEEARKLCGENHARLVEVKRAYDPTNLFHVDKNIEA
jgi:FAD/FMN-containing dehydrogenase